MTTQHFEHTLADYRNRSAVAIDSIPVQDVAVLAGQLATVRALAGRVFCIGNGGSAANVAHLVLHLREHGIMALDLMADVAAMSALANDIAYDEAPATTLRRWHCGPNDMVLALTGKGASVNVNTALIFAAGRQARCWAVTGFDGGGTRKLARTVHIPVSEYGPFEDGCGAVLHMLSVALASQDRPS